jgi:NAD-dependent dihydropyrimidine dehydrogenase PreA subunit
MSKRLSVIVSQAQGKNPAKRKLEEDIVAGLLFESGIDVTIVPNLYDIQADSSSQIALQGVSGNAVLCSWLFERAARWVLDRHGVHGHDGTVLLKAEESDEEDTEGSEGDADDKDRVIDSRDIPNRKIYCLDLKASNSANDFIAEVKRIHAENAVQVIGLSDVLNAAPLEPAGNTNGNGQTAPNAVVNRIEEKSGRRWYPVIDYSRCTNCMECIDFCLFGVYGVDRIDTILVEQPDNCRKGCPACSRVCPENAIMFPQHKTPAIAGSMDAAASLKIDLSQLFGAPKEGKSAAELAALERDEQLVMAGRQAVGSEGIRSSRAEGSSEPDELDDLVDELNDLDL